LQSTDPADHTKQAEEYFCKSDTSGCALTIRGFWRKLGLMHPLLGAYYTRDRVGHAPLDLLTIAGRYGAHVNGYALARVPGTTGAYEPKIGDVGYFFTIIEIKPVQSGYEIVSIDGGQTVADAHGVKQQIITRRFRTWKRGGNLLTDFPKLGGFPKQVIGVIDVSKIPFPESKACV
jgi:hypothetical protein